MKKILIFAAVVMLCFVATAHAKQITIEEMGSPGDPSGDGIQPVWYAGNPDCEDCNFIGAYEFKIEDGIDGIHEIDSIGKVKITVEEASNGYSGQVFHWEVWETMSILVSGVIVKGGDNANCYTYDPSDTEDTMLHAPVNPNGNGNGKYYDLSNITFCYQAAVPEPSILLLMGTSMLGLAVFRRKSQR